MIITQKLFLFFASILSRVPMRFLHLKSDFFYLILYHLIAYRKKVVYQNLQNTFPKKSDREIKKIAKQFYHNLCDLFFEIIKLGKISEKELSKRFVIKNPEVIDELFKQNRSILVTIGHIGNWEWLGPKLASTNQFKVFGPAKPLNDPFFNHFMNANRSRFGFSPIKYTHTLRTLVHHKDECTASIMAADQSPLKSDQNYWAPFLYRETPFYLGIEKMAKSLNLAVVYFDIQRIKRGYYEVEISLITDKPKQCKEYEIIDTYISHLEQSIINNPDNWLWSHRRWKYEKDTKSN